MQVSNDMINKECENTTFSMLHTVIIVTDNGWYCMNPNTDVSAQWPGTEFYFLLMYVHIHIGSKLAFYEFAQQDRDKNRSVLPGRTSYEVKTVYTIQIWSQESSNKNYHQLVHRYTVGPLTQNSRHITFMPTWSFLSMQWLKWWGLDSVARTTTLPWPPKIVIYVKGCTILYNNFNEVTLNRDNL